MRGSRIDQGAKQRLPDVNLELHRLDRGDDGDGVEQNVGVILLVHYSGVIVVHLQQVYTFHWTHFEVPVGKFLRVVVPFAALPLGSHLGGGHPLEPWHGR
jgi:hypothetical protein